MMFELHESFRNFTRFETRRHRATVGNNFSNEEEEEERPKTILFAHRGTLFFAGR